MEPEKINLTDTEKQQLLNVAGLSIDEGLANDRPYLVPLHEYEGTLAQGGASFVTLNLDGQLRGCIGSLEARQPLVSDVAENAYNAAFRDPRFSQVMPSERKDLEIHISVLEKPVDLPVADEEELVAKLKPGKDGLILRDGSHRATFLPSVWKQIPEPKRFVRELKLKAGLGVEHWSDSLVVQRYGVIEFS